MISSKRPASLLAAIAAGLAIVVGCSSDSGESEQVQSAATSQQQAAGEVESAEATSQAASQATNESTSTSEATDSNDAAGEDSSAGQSQADAPAQEQQTITDTEESSGSQAEQVSEDASDEASDGIAASVLEEADYDDLNPRLQLLRDGGYPVYVSDDDYTLALGTPDLSPGRHRISIVIEGPTGLVEFPAIAVTVIPERTPSDAVEVVARFARFPDGVRGFHVTTVDFREPGRWNLILHVPSEQGFDDIGIAIDVPSSSSAPSIGAAAPASASRTLLDVPNIADLSTGETPDPGLYLVSLADALEQAKPFVVVFASPGFCTNAFCGPQAEVLSQIRERFGDEANYIHVDLFENPEQVRLGETPIETPILEEWGLHTDEWTFVVGADGRVAARFEAFAPYAEVEAALASVLGS